MNSTDLRYNIKFYDRQSGGEDAYGDALAPVDVLVFDTYARVRETNAMDRVKDASKIDTIITEFVFRHSENFIYKDSYIIKFNGREYETTTPPKAYDEKREFDVIFSTMEYK